MSKKVWLPLFGTLVGLSLFAGQGCSSLLYHPDHVMYVEEETMEYKPEDVVLKINDKESVHSWYLSSLASPKGVIVFFHGNGQNRTAHIVGLYWLVKEGYDILALEYPGYGETDGVPTPKNTVEAGHAALRYAVTRKPKVPLIIYGQSLGGTVAMRAAIDLRNEIKPALLVADSTFLSYEKVGRKLLANSWLTWLLQPLANIFLSDSFAPGNDIAKLDVPVLVIHAKDDNVIPFQFGEEIFRLAHGPKEIWLKEEGGHIGTFNKPHGAEIREKFLAKLKALGAR